MRKKKSKKFKSKDEPAGFDCDVCGHPMVINLGKYGKFYACSNFPDCRNTKPIVKEIGVTCPVCHEGQVIERKSKKNNYSMVVLVSQNVNSLLGINQSAEIVQNVTDIWSRRKSKAVNK